MRRNNSQKIRWLSTVLASAVLSILNARVSAEVLPDSQIIFTGPFSFFGASNAYLATVKQNVAGDYTETIFSYSPTSLGIITLNADEGSDWYLVNAGDVFSAETISANQFPALYKAPFFPPPPPKPISLGSVYLGVNTGTRFSPPDNDRGVFGWLELNNTGTTLTAVRNAMAYAEPGIIVGTTVAVPEPGTLILLAAPLALLRCTPRRRQAPHAKGAKLQK